jgi:hypothetical protein
MLRNRQECHTTTVETANNEVCEKSFCTLLAGMKPNWPKGLRGGCHRVAHNGLERAGDVDGIDRGNNRVLKLGSACTGYLSGRSKTIQARRGFASTVPQVCADLVASHGARALGANGSRLFEEGERPHRVPARYGLRRFAESPGDFALAADGPSLASVCTVE